MDARVVSNDGRSTGSPGRASVAAALGLPLGILCLAYALWWISDRLANIGPIDRAAFGWIVVIPVWIAAPVVAAFWWRRLEPSSAGRVALLLGAIVAAVAAVLFWSSVAMPDCPYGPSRQPVEWIAPSILLGAAIGAGPALSGLLGSRSVREGRRGIAIVQASGVEILMIAVAILLLGAIIAGRACQNPH